jgi:hypothetical protein
MVSQFGHLLKAQHLCLAEALVQYISQFVLLPWQDALVSVSWQHSDIAKWLWGPHRGGQLSVYPPYKAGTRD